MTCQKYYIIGLGLMVSLIFLLPRLVSAQTAEHDFYLNFFDQQLTKLEEIPLLTSDFNGMTDFSIVDFGGDNVSEIAVAVGYQAPPKVKVFRNDRSLINEWQPYPDGYQGRINIAAADFDNDGKEELVTSPGEGGGPHVRIFNGHGQAVFNAVGFFADSDSYRLGTEIAVGDVNADQKPEIIVSLIGENKNLIKIFNNLGQQIYNTIEIEAQQYLEPNKIAAYDLDKNGQDEIIIGSSMANQPIVTVIDYYGHVLSEFMAYGLNFEGGFDVAAATFDDQPLIITSAGYGGGPHIRFFNLAGEVQIDPKFFAYDQDFRGGVNIDVDESDGRLKIATLPQTSLMSGELTRFGKVIKVDISEQKLFAYEKGRLVKDFLISSGRYGFDTPLGEFSVYRKNPLARMSWYYGPDNPNNYDLPNVPHILSFYGAYTIHGAYWHHNWGYRMSHGCVNVDLKNAEWLFNWTPVGTPVIIEP